MSSQSYSRLTQTPYDVIGPEYYDATLHPTCHNFNFLSRSYIAHHFPDVERGLVIEVGAGSSSAAPAMVSRGIDLGRLRVTDASKTMLQYSREWQKKGAKLTVALASSLPIADASASLVVAGLGDPFNEAAFWKEAARVLVPGGRVIFTTPAHEWAMLFRITQGRMPIDCAEFELRGGRAVEARSIVVPPADQLRMVESSKLMPINFDSLGIEALKGQALSPKIAMFKDSLTAVVSGFVAVKPKSCT